MVSEVSNKCVVQEHCFTVMIRNTPSLFDRQLEQMGPERIAAMNATLADQERMQQGQMAQQGSQGQLGNIGGQMGQMGPRGAMQGPRPRDAIGASPALLFNTALYSLR